MSIANHKEWEAVVERLKKIANDLGSELLQVAPVPDNIGKIGELQGAMKMVYRVLNLPKELWPPPEDEGEE